MDTLQILNVTGSTGSISQGNLIIFFGVESLEKDFGVSLKGIVERSPEYLSRFNPGERNYWEGIARQYYPLPKKSSEG